MPCLLSSKAQSFAPQEFTTTETNCNLFLLPLKSQENSVENILMLHGSQIFLFDSRDLIVKEEILLESKIEAFKFENQSHELFIKLDRVSLKEEDDYSDTIRNDSNDTIRNDSNDNIRNNSSDNIIINSNDKITLNNSNDNIIYNSTSDNFIVTSKNCTWTLPSPIISFNFSKIVTCHPASEFTDKNKSFSVLEVIKDDRVACIVENQLQILSKNKREIISSVALPENLLGVKSLIWIDQAIFIFSILDFKLQILKFSLMKFSPPTNGCNWPLVTWSQDTINVHRSGVICPTWYKLKNTEVWDVIKSPIGNVCEIVVSADGSCFLVCGEECVAFCDFFSRTWQAIYFPTLKYPKWLGNNHVVALTPDNSQLILIKRYTNEIMKIPIEDPETIRFIDTYNNQQLLIQKSETISIFAFDSETANFTFVKTLPFTSKTEIKQAAFFNETIYTLDKSGNFLFGSQSKSGCYESFVVLSTGQILLVNSAGSLLFQNDQQDTELNFTPLAVLPFTNCFTVLTCESLNFSLHSRIQSKFLLPELFLILTSQSPKILESWFEDPLFPLALEYILLGSLGKPEILATLQTIVKNEIVFAKAIVSLTRKIEEHEATSRLFAHLPQFTPLKICQLIPFDDKLNFLSYLAKAHSVNKCQEAIISILDELFSKRKYHDRIEKIKEFLSAFAGLEEVFSNVLRNKITRLWKSGRLLKAYELSKFTQITLTDDDGDDDALVYFKLDAAVSNVNIADFRSWLHAQSLPKTERLVNNLLPKQNG